MKLPSPQQILKKCLLNLSVNIPLVLLGKVRVSEAVRFEWLRACAQQSTQLSFLPDSEVRGVSDSQAGFPAAFFIRPAPCDVTDQPSKGKPCGAFSGSRGQARMGGRAGCCGELFSTPSPEQQPLTHPAEATFLFP